MHHRPHAAHNQAATRHRRVTRPKVHRLVVHRIGTAATSHEDRVAYISECTERVLLVGESASGYPLGVAEDEQSAGQDEARFEDEGAAVGKPESAETERTAMKDDAPAPKRNFLDMLVDLVRGKRR